MEHPVYDLHLLKTCYKSFWVLLPIFLEQWCGFWSCDLWIPVKTPTLFNCPVKGTVARNFYPFRSKNSSWAPYTLYTNNKQIDTTEEKVCKTGLACLKVECFPHTKRDGKSHETVPVKAAAPDAGCPLQDPGEEWHLLQGVRHSGEKKKFTTL